MKLIDPPNDHWVENLTPGDLVYDPKECQFLEVSSSYVPPGPHKCAGEIGLHEMVWYIKADGTGFDGSVLLVPTECIKAYQSRRRIVLCRQSTMSRLVFTLWWKESIAMLINKLEDEYDGWVVMSAVFGEGV